MPVASWEDALGSATAAVNRTEASPRQASAAPTAVQAGAKYGSAVIPLHVWEERCRLLKEEEQPRRKLFLSDYYPPAPQNEQENRTPPPEEAAAQEERPEAAAAANAAPQKPRVAPPRRKRITEAVVLRARIQEATKNVAACDPPLEEPFAGPYIPQEKTSRSLAPRQTKARQDSADPFARHSTPRESGADVLPLRDALTARAPYRVVNHMPHWTKESERMLTRPRKDTPREIKPKAVYSSGNIRGARMANEEARKRLGDMLQLPSTLADAVSRNVEWLANVPGGNLEVPLGRLDPREFHPARSARMQIPEANLRVR